MRVLVTGGEGQLGRSLRATQPAEADAAFPDRGILDITDREAVRRAVAAAQPSVIVNAAAYTAVDRAETDQDQAFLVNATGVGFLAEAAGECGSRLLHVSTDFVFDGAASTPYRPDEPPSPINAYGASKLEGEQIARDVLGDQATVVRTAWLYSAYARNFVTTMLGLMKSRDEIRVVSDQIGTPTWTRSLAEALWALAASDDRGGILHWTDAGTASWYDLAVAVQEEGLAAGVLGRATSVLPISTADYPTPARRPAYSVLDTSGARDRLGMQPPHWRVNLRRMLGELAGG